MNKSGVVSGGRRACYFRECNWARENIARPPVTGAWSAREAWLKLEEGVGVEPLNSTPGAEEGSLKASAGIW